MRWQEGGESENVEDQRGLPVGMALGGAGTVIVSVTSAIVMTPSNGCSAGRTAAFWR